MIIVVATFTIIGTGSESGRAGDHHRMRRCVPDLICAASQLWVHDRERPTVKSSTATQHEQTTASNGNGAKGAPPQHSKTVETIQGLGLGIVLVVAIENLVHITHRAEFRPEDVGENAGGRTATRIEPGKSAPLVGRRLLWVVVVG